jgi:integrase-like protein
VYKRFRTRHRGVSYRVRADGSKSCSVYCAGRWVSVQGGEREAVRVQAELRAKRARGERVTPSAVTFAELAEAWLASKRVRRWTRMGYRASLDNVLLPRLGRRRLAAITADDVAALIRELEAKGYAPSCISNLVKPLAGTFKLGLRRRRRRRPESRE